MRISVFTLLLLLFITTVITPLTSQPYFATALSSQRVFNVRLLVLLAGIDAKPAIAPLYEVPIDNGNYIVRIYVDIKRVDTSLIASVLSSIRRISSEVPHFVKNYIAYRHPDWVVNCVELVKADDAEIALYTKLRDIVRGYHYILLLFYLPPPEGCVRVYYIAKYIPEIKRVAKFVGMIGFGGNTPLYFIDLSAIPSYHPSKEQPLYLYGIHFNYINNPPLWDLKSYSERVKLVTRYVERYIGFLIARPPIKLRVPWRPLYFVNVTIIDFSGGRAIHKALSLMNRSRLTTYLEALNPLARWRIEIHIVRNGNATPFRIAIERSLRFNEFVVLQYETLYKLARSRGIAVVKISPLSVVIPVYIFVHTTPLHMTYERGKLNFTGCATDLAIFFTVPGYAYRVYSTGLDLGIAHEVAHVLGLGHPFEGIDLRSMREAMDWSMDFVASLLSYAPTIAGWRGGLFYYDARALCRLQIWQIIETAKSLGIAISPELFTYIESGGCLDAGLEILYRVLTILNTTTVYTVTKKVTITAMLPRTVTVTLPKTVTIWRGFIKTVTSVSTVTKLYPIYITRTVTLPRTITMWRNFIYPIYITNYVTVTKSVATTKEVTVTVKSLETVYSLSTTTTTVITEQRSIHIAVMMFVIGIVIGLLFARSRR